MKLWTDVHLIWSYRLGTTEKEANSKISSCLLLADLCEG